MAPSSPRLIVRHLGLQSYVSVWKSMQTFTDTRNENTLDECWIVEHPPVFTQGQAGKPEHLLNAHAIPLVQSDRGGQITYHSPGQMVIYVLLDLKRRKKGIRDLVRDLEKALIRFLAYYQITAEAKTGAPGIYVDNKKIASIGLRVRHGCTYHGLSFNFNMDLTPFSYINPCGYEGLKMTQLSDYIKNLSQKEVEDKLIASLAKELQYSIIDNTKEYSHEAA